MLCSCPRDFRKYSAIITLCFIHVPKIRQIHTHSLVSTFGRCHTSEAGRRSGARIQNNLPLRRPSLTPYRTESDQTNSVPTPTTPSPTHAILDPISFSRSLHNPPATENPSLAKIMYSTFAPQNPQVSSCSVIYLIRNPKLQHSISNN